VSETEKSTPKFRPNPKRQLILVLLALVGLGVGYGLGFVFKRPAPPPPPPAPAPQTAPAPAPQPLAGTSQQLPTTPQPYAAAPAMPQPVLPEDGDHQESDGLRAYEEALPKEIVVVMEPMTPAPGKPAEETPPAGVKKTNTPEKPAATPPQTEQAAVPPADAAAPKSAAGKVAPQASPPKTAPTPPPQEAAPGPTPAWRKFAVAVKPDGRPKIAIVMDDLGIDRARTRRTMGLPGPLTLSFLAYARELQLQADTGRGRGHEIWLHVPMEPGSATIDPGPNVLLTGVPATERAHALQWNLDQLMGFVGINNHMGSRFTASLDGMRGVMAELKKRGLAFLDSVTSPKSVGHVAAREAGIPFMLRNVFLDHQDDRKAVEAQLHKLEVLAQKHGEAVAIGHPREATLAALGPWLKTLDEKGFQLVPASALLRVPQQLVANKPKN